MILSSLSRLLYSIYRLILKVSLFINSVASILMAALIVFVSYSFYSYYKHMTQPKMMGGDPKKNT